MTDDRFDALTRRLGQATSRRTMFKGLMAAAVGGVVARLGGDSAEARTQRQACRRLHQTCGAGQPCCTHLACQNGDCCRPLNETCYQDSDCCPDNVCRPNPHGLGNRCLPPGGVGALCVEQSDCAGGLICDTYTGTCAPGCLAQGTACQDDTDCCSGLICAESPAQGEIGDTYCVPCLANGQSCVDNHQCCSAFCDPYSLTCQTVGQCIGAGDECAVNEDCCSGVCDAYTGTCIPGLLVNGSPCAADEDCASGRCCQEDGVCKPLTTQVYNPVAGTDCAVNEDCCGSDLCVNGRCYPCANNQQLCFMDDECCSGYCSHPGGSTEGVCADRPTLLANGSPCETSDQCVSNNCCATDSVCKPPTTQVYNPVAGTDCLANEDCCGSDLCVNGRCYPCANNNQFCVNDNECCSGFCNHPGGASQGVCADPVQDLCAGVICNPSGECATSTCNPATGQCDAGNQPNNTPCSIGACVNGVCTDLCVGMSCDDGNECTTDTCDPHTGTCSHTNVADTTPCAGGQCMSGSCVCVNPSGCTTNEDCCGTDTCQSLFGDPAICAACLGADHGPCTVGGPEVCCPGFSCQFSMIGQICQPIPAG